MKFDENSYIEELAQDLALKAHLRWEEIQVEKATTEQLQKTKRIIDKELTKRNKNNECKLTKEELLFLSEILFNSMIENNLSMEKSRLYQKLKQLIESEAK